MLHLLPVSCHCNHHDPTSFCFLLHQEFAFPVHHQDKTDDYWVEDVWTTCYKKPWRQWELQQEDGRVTRRRRQESEDWNLLNDQRDSHRECFSVLVPIPISDANLGYQHPLLQRWEHQVHRPRKLAGGVNPLQLCLHCMVSCENQASTYYKCNINSSEINKM